MLTGWIAQQDAVSVCAAKVSDFDSPVFYLEEEPPYMTMDKVPGLRVSPQKRSGKSLLSAIYWKGLESTCQQVTIIHMQSCYYFSYSVTLSVKPVILRGCHYDHPQSTC